eukprot:3073069-Rhodomonas_salina.2
MEESDSPSFWVDGTPYPLLPSKLSGPDLQAAEQKLQTWGLVSLPELLRLTQKCDALPSLDRDFKAVAPCK